MDGIGLKDAFKLNFLGAAPNWYKLMIVGFLILNPLVFFTVGPFVAGWCLIVEFIATLALSLKCYPLPSGGLLAIEAVIIGLTSPGKVYEEVAGNLPTILLLMFMVAGIYFMKEFLLFIFSRLLVNIKSKLALSFIFCFMGAFLSAFLDALTVTAVIISVAYGFYNVYQKYASQQYAPLNDDTDPKSEYRQDLEQFRGFLRNLMMHAAVGTALGGALTLVGEPQNLLIGSVMHWDFITFFRRCFEVSVPVFFSGLITCVVVEVFGIIGYGYKMPDRVRRVLENEVKATSGKMDSKMIARLIVMGTVAILLIIALAFHLAEVGLVGLCVIILTGSFTGVIEEHDFGKAFVETMPFTSLLVVFFTIVAVIGDQQLFKPIISHVLALSGKEQLVSFFAANGILSAISDNVFVATVYINEAKTAFEAGIIDADQFQKLAVATNMGTNVPSVATPNGQAAFLFLLTSALAPVIRLSYVEMLKLAFPYAVIMSATGLLATYFFL